MPSLKSLRDRIKAVRSTQKITKAMQLVAAGKLRRARQECDAAAPYAHAMSGLVHRLVASLPHSEAPILAVGNGKPVRAVLCVVCSSDNGLCGGFNAHMVKKLRAHVHQLHEAGISKVGFYILGSKARDVVCSLYGAEALVDVRLGFFKKRPQYEMALELAKVYAGFIEAQTWDRVDVLYTEFRSMLSQHPVDYALLPCNAGKVEDRAGCVEVPLASEPGSEEIVDQLLPRYVATQLFHVLLQSFASEQAARMTAMDAATRNAGSMIKRLSLQFNRSRQAAITKELIEIISGAEAV